MPLPRGSSSETFSKNVSELMSAYKQKGHIGTGPKEGKAKARKRALAIAFSMKGKGARGKIGTEEKG